MPTHICVTCGTQFPHAQCPPECCPICEDERQYVGLQGQRWITLEALGKTHRNTLYQEGQGIWGIGTEPKFAIGQRALLIQTPAGNLLWDCISLIDPDTIALVKALGGISAIAISHPHYYSSMIEWSHAFGDVPIYLHENDRQWVQRPDPSIRFWQGETHALNSTFTLIRLGGHFPGYQVLHGAGALFTGDLPQVCMDRRWVSFMYSFPNYVPLPSAEVDSIVNAVEPFAFDRVYGAWWDRNVESDAKAAVRRSAERYKRALDRRPGD